MLFDNDLRLISESLFPPVQTPTSSLIQFLCPGYFFDAIKSLKFNRFHEYKSNIGNYTNFIRDLLYNHDNSWHCQFDNVHIW